MSKLAHIFSALEKKYIENMTGRERVNALVNGERTDSNFKKLKITFQYESVRPEVGRVIAVSNPDLKSRSTLWSVPGLEAHIVTMAQAAASLAALTLCEKGHFSVLSSMSNFKLDLPAEESGEESIFAFGKAESFSKNIREVVNSGVATEIITAQPGKLITVGVDVHAKESKIATGTFYHRVLTLDSLS